MEQGEGDLATANGGEGDQQECIDVDAQVQIDSPGVLEDKEENTEMETVKDSSVETEGSQNGTGSTQNLDKDVVEDARDDELILVKKGGKLDENKMYYIIAPWTMPTCIWTDVQDKILWIGHPGKKLSEVVDQITALLAQENPCNILVLSLQAFIGDTNVEALEKVLDDITRLAMGSIHKLAWCCVFYVPQLERVWHRTTAVNLHIRLCNLNMDQAPCNLHKKMLVSVNRGRVFYIRPNLFTEFVNESGVGETLNHAGLLRVKEVVDLYCANAFGDQPRLPSQAVPGDVEPPPLFLSRGYSKNPKMMEHIKQAGLRMPSRPQSATGGGRNRSNSAGRVDPPKNYSRGRTKVKSNGLVWTEEDDLTAAEIREKRQLEARKKLEKRRAGPDVDELAGRLKDLRLKGVKDNQRSKRREKFLEGRVKELEREVNENERRMRDQRDKLRELCDSDRKIREVKQEMKEKDNKIRRMKNELAEVRKEMDAWRDGYEKICEVLDGKRRRK